MRWGATSRKEEGKEEVKEGRSDEVSDVEGVGLREAGAAVNAEVRASSLVKTPKSNSTSALANATDTRWDTEGVEEGGRTESKGGDIAEEDFDEMEEVHGRSPETALSTSQRKWRGV